MGCKSLRESVKETSIQRGVARETEKSRQLQEGIVERASLFYHEQPKNEIKRDKEWLKNLKVREIDYIETIYKLGNVKKTKKNNTNQN